MRGELEKHVINVHDEHMRPIKAPILYEDLTYKIIGCAMKVHTELGPIHKELIYQKALEKALLEQKISVRREVNIPVKYQGEIIGRYVPDFAVDGKVLVEIKARDKLLPGAEAQIGYYLRATGYKIGLLINFGTSKLEVKRRIWG
jgi:GxxExxY protein